MIDLATELGAAVAQLDRNWTLRLREVGVPEETFWHSPPLVGISSIEVYRGGLYEPRDTGPAAVLVPVGTPYHPDWELEDIVAFHLEDPDRWWRRTGEAVCLGTFNISEGRLRPLQIHATPLDWLTGKADGLVVLDWVFSPMAHLSGAGHMQADSPQLKRRLERRIQQAALKLFDISVCEVSNAAR